MKLQFLDLAKQYKSIKKEIDAAVKKVFASGVFTAGPAVKQFEEDFAKYCKAKYCLGVNSGTSALHLALLALGVGRGDEVITQPNTFFATAEAIWHTGAKPVFVDVQERNYGIDAAKIEQAINKKTKCIIPVHLFGFSADIEAIQKVAKKHGLPVIEDTCQGHGVLHKGKQLGTFGQVGCFSFYPGKVLGAAGEAGAVLIIFNSAARTRFRMLKLIAGGASSLVSRIRILHSLEYF